MKRVIIGMGLALACAAGITGCSVGEKPFADIAASEISSAAVSLTPPDKMLEIEDTEKLAGLLQDVVIYGKDDSYTEYDLHCRRCIQPIKLDLRISFGHLMYFSLTNI